MAPQKPYIVVHGVPDNASRASVESLIREIFGLYPGALHLGEYNYGYGDIRKRMLLLDEREASMVVMRHNLHGDPEIVKRVTFNVIGKAHGLTGGRVRQILSRVYASLRFWLPFGEQMRRVPNPLSDLNLPVQVFRSFLGAGIESLDQIKAMTHEDVLQVLRHHDAKHKKHVFEQLSGAGIVPPWARDVEGTLENLRLSPRPYNALRFKLKITDVGQLCELTEDDLLKLPGFGEKSLAEVKQRLKAANRSLKQ